MKLKELVEKYGLDRFILCEKGKGRNHRRDGIRKAYDCIAAHIYGDIELRPVEKKITVSGYFYRWDSDWIKVTKVTEMYYEEGVIRAPTDAFAPHYREGVVKTSSESYEIRVRF